MRLGRGLRNASLETKRQVLRKRLRKSGESRQFLSLGETSSNPERGRARAVKGLLSLTYLTSVF